MATMSTGINHNVPFSHRLVDYFVVCGLGEVVEPLSEGLGSTNVDPTKVRLKPTMLDRYPYQDWKDHNLTPHSVSLFCFPSGISLTPHPSLPLFFTFVLTEALGTRVYGSCLVFHEQVAPQRLASIVVLPDQTEEVTAPYSGNLSRRGSLVVEEKQTLFEPKCLCLLSHYPFYHGFKQFLCEVFRISCSAQNVPLERIVSNLFEVPLPPLGRVRVNMSISNKKITFWRPPPNALPLADFPIEILFHCLDEENIITLFLYVLLERKVMFLSSKVALLTIASEAILTLIFPMRWQGAYVPLLPSPLYDFVSAPVPFMMGAQGDEFSTSVLDPEVVLVDLDTNSVTGGGSLPEPPKKELLKLRKAVRTFADVYMENHPVTQTIDDAFRHPPPPENIDDFNLDDLNTADAAVPDFSGPSETQVGHNDDVERGKFYRRQLRASFLRFFVALLGKYRKYIDDKMLKITSGTNSTFNLDTAFNKKAFVEDFVKAERPFVSEVVSTQMWSMLISERLEYHRAILLKQPHANTFVECRFFDECIDAKDNRSKLHVYKKGTPFLSLMRYAARDEYDVPSPDVRGLDPNAKFSYTRFPVLKPELMRMRQVAELVQEQDVRQQQGASHRTPMGITMAALLKGRESSLFSTSRAKDAAIIQLLQGELDSHRERLSELVSKVEAREAELRAKEQMMEKHKLELAAMQVELANMKMHFSKAGMPVPQQPGVGGTGITAGSSSASLGTQAAAGAGSAFGLSRVMGRARENSTPTRELFTSPIMFRSNSVSEDLSQQHANGNHSPRGHHQQNPHDFALELQNPPLVKKVNDMYEFAEKLEQQLLVSLNRQNLRVQLLSRTCSVLRIKMTVRLDSLRQQQQQQQQQLQEPLSTNSEGRRHAGSQPNLDLDFAFDTNGTSALGTRSSHEVDKTHPGLTQESPGMGRRARSTITPRRATLAGQGAMQAAAAATANTMAPQILAKQMLSRAEATGRQLLLQFPALCTMSDRNWLRLCEEARSHALVLESQLGGAMMRIACQANTLEEARTLLRKSMEVEQAGADHVRDCLRCNELLQTLQALVKVLECLESSDPQEPDWQAVLTVKRQLQDQLNTSPSQRRSGSRVSDHAPVVASKSQDDSDGGGEEDDDGSNTSAGKSAVAPKTGEQLL